MRKSIAFIFTLVLCQYILAQDIVSPNVASLGEYALYPVSPFTGQANIEVPITEINFRDINVPVSLQYNTKGNKVKVHPGFVGLGWTLKAGGVIIRNPNYSIDEKNSPVYEEHDFYNRDNLSYSKNMDLVAQNYNNIDSIKEYAFDKEDVPKATHFQKIDGNPDEFIFNFNGYSGVFYLTSKGIKIRPNGPYKLTAKILETKSDLKSKRTESVGYKVPKTIYKIEIRDDKGYSYVFGGTNNSIEISNRLDEKSLNYISYLNYPRTKNMLNNRATIPYNEVNAWNLTQIKSPNGDLIKFNYERNGVIINPHKTYLKDYKNKTVRINEKLFKFIPVYDYREKIKSYYKGMASSFYVVYPSYLKSIETPLDKLNFRYSEDKNSLHYNMAAYSNPMQIPPYKYLPKSKWLKLEEIYHTALNKRIKFNYRNEAQVRLRLQEVIYKSLNANLYSYKFKYNSKDLPDYQSLDTDHWGYYNGNFSFDSSFYNNKRPNKYNMDAEILEEVTNPLGGKQIITYEPHYYSKYAIQFPFGVKDTLENVMAGGLRVRSITANVSPGEEVLKKEYFYTFDYINNGSRSSGVLNGIPKYLYKEGVGKFEEYYRALHLGTSSLEHYGAYFTSDQATQYSFTSGSHITYTEVTTKDKTGYTVNKFSNHDNGFTDKAPSIIYGNLKTDRFVEKIISKDLFRGLLLESSIYSNDKSIKKQIINEYSIDTLLTKFSPAYSESVPFIQKYALYSRPDLNAGRVSSGRIYTLPPVLKKKTIKTYLKGDIITVVDNFTYGDRSLHSKIIKKESLTSNGDKIEKEYYYPSDLTAPVMPPLYASKRNVTTSYSTVDLDKVFPRINLLPYCKELIDENRIAFPLLTRESKNGEVLSSKVVKYGKFNDLLLPSEVYSLKGKEPRDGKNKILTEGMDKELTYHSYDKYGNPQEVSKLDGSHTYYIWGYHGQYPIAKLENFTSVQAKSIQTLINRAVSKSNSETDRTINNEGQEGELRRILNLIRNHSSIKDKDILVTTYTYDPLVGMTSMTDSCGKTIYYNYDLFNRLIQEKDSYGNVLKFYKYNYKNE